MRSATLFATALLATYTTASILPSRKPVHTRDDDDDDDNYNGTPLPLIVWHGLGDAFNGEGIQMVGELADAINPGTLFYPIALAPDAGSDRSATFFGNVTEQIQLVCDALAAHPIISTAPAIDAIGFSQGGQFLRGYVERCNKPPQHNGIEEFKACGPVDFLCKGAMALLRFNTWSGFVQSRLVPAQYFRDVKDYQSYLDNSNFLADINNERPFKNEQYKKNIQKLENFVMYIFKDDTTVIPKETAWFAEVADGNVTPLHKTQSYKEDWLGLKELDRKGGLRFRTIAGDHMQITEHILNETMTQYFGPFKRTFTPEPKTEREEFVSEEL
ncbi:Palmitoyl-protein thioesterase 1 [Cladobotryum mycophilum]|uniref:Palmitoyl-protein thioesterase 1 n=1 Tax=Cladobotryum mycophilum TaxID=491253 RepID=A0ABR0SI92_9HYPO